MSEERKDYGRPDLSMFPPVSYETWRQEAVATLKGADFDKRLLTKTYEGITLKPIYTEADFAGDCAFPGEGDYLRGTRAAGYMDKPWDMAQRVCAATPKAANEKLLHALTRGAGAVNADLSRDVRIDSEADFAVLLNGVDPEKTPLHLQAGASSLAAVTYGVRAVPGFDKATGCVGADPLGTLARDGALDKTLPVLYAEMAEAVRLCRKQAPGVRAVLCDANVYADGGANAVQEAAFAVATASEYIAALLEQGVSPDDAAGSIRLSVSLGSNFFMEIAKLRALRTVFARMARAYGCSEAACKAEVFARTASFTKSVYDPYVNILRATSESFAGVVGGVDALEVGQLSEPIGAGDELTERVARNIQLMLAEEFGLLEPVDPAGGSWYVETLTRQLIDAIGDKFKAVEQQGGMYAYLAGGAAQAEIAKVLQDRLSKLATRYDRAVGTNMYANVGEKPLTLKKLERPAKGKAQAPAVEVARIAPHRWTEQFEALRQASEAFAAKNGRPLTVFLANMGPIPQHKARADFATGFFEVGAFRVIGNDGFACVDCAAKAAVESGADVTVICSTDETYPELVPPLAKAVKAARPDMYVVLAGAPAPEMKAAYDEAGVDEYIHVRANCLALLTKIQAERGIGQ